MAPLAAASYAGQVDRPETFGEGCGHGWQRAGHELVLQALVRISVVHFSLLALDPALELPPKAFGLRFLPGDAGCRAHFELLPGQARLDSQPIEEVQQ